MHQLGELNKFAFREVHPMATVQSSLAMLGWVGFGCFPIFMPMAAFGKFHWKTSPVLSHSSWEVPLLKGLCIAPEIFQSEKNHILGNIDVVVIHVDDILVFGDDRQQDDSRLSEVLKCLKEMGITQ